jgi:hypothetical protein
MAKEQRHELNRRDAEIERLRRQVAEAAAAKESLTDSRRDYEAVRQERDALRGIVSALVAQMAQRSVVAAVEIERDLLDVASRFVEGVPASPPSKPPAPDDSSGNSARRLRLSH